MGLLFFFPKTFQALQGKQDLPFLLQTHPSHGGSAQPELCSLGRGKEGIDPFMCHNFHYYTAILKNTPGNSHLPIEGVKRPQTIPAPQSSQCFSRTMFWLREKPSSIHGRIFPLIFQPWSIFFPSLEALSVLRLCSTPTNAHFRRVVDDFRSADRNVWVTEEL